MGCAPRSEFSLNHHSPSAVLGDKGDGAGDLSNSSPLRPRIAVGVVAMAEAEANSVPSVPMTHPSSSAVLEAPWSQTGGGGGRVGKQGSGGSLV